MSDRALLAAALIVAGSFSAPRYALSAADSNVAWRMDTWSGEIDLCAATYLPNGPLVRCGALVVVSPPKGSTPMPQPPAQAPASPLDAPGRQTL
jgi:hypothetical protein